MNERGGADVQLLRATHKYFPKGGCSRYHYLMKIKTVTWNIGGAKLLQEGADQTLLASYTVDGIDTIIAWLKNENPDIITLQETQKNNQIDQAALIADGLGYEYYFHDSISDSHIEDGFKLGHAILSRYPLTDHATEFFNNPNLEIEFEGGIIAKSHDKGFSSCNAKINNIDLRITTLHLTPVRRFNIDLVSDQASSILSNVQEMISSPSDRWIIQGDFNIDSNELASHLPTLFNQGLDEVNIAEPTTPKGHKYDHVLFRNIKLLDSRVDSTALTDHFPVVCEFEI